MGVDHQMLKGMVTVLVLRLLGEDDMYGYQMIKELEQRSMSAFTLNEGALYPILHKLETKGYIESYWEESENSRKRKYYHLTLKGNRMLAEKTGEWTFFARAVDMVLRITRNLKLEWRKRYV